MYSTGRYSNLFFTCAPLLTHVGVALEIHKKRCTPSSAQGIQDRLTILDPLSHLKTRSIPRYYNRQEFTQVFLLGGLHSATITTLAISPLTPLATSPLGVRKKVYYRDKVHLATRQHFYHLHRIQVVQTQTVLWYWTSTPS
jgi:hypothetical protein